MPTRRLTAARAFFASLAALFRRRRAREDQGPPVSQEGTPAAGLAWRLEPTRGTPLPRPPSLLDDVRRVCQARGEIDPEAAEWIAPLIEQDLATGSSGTELKIRAAGDPVPAEVKRQLGVRANTKLGSRYLAALTPKGRQKPMWAGALLFRTVIGERSNRHTLDGCRGAGLRVQILPTDGKLGEDYCRAVRAYRKRTYRPDEAPALPVPGCDLDYCGCSYISAWR